MVHELGPLRMALDEYDRAESRRECETAERKVRKLLTIGMVKVLVAAVDEPAEDEPEVEPAPDE